MDVVAPRPPDRQIPAFSNIDVSVGEKGGNTSVEDILLVQFLLRKAGEASGLIVAPHRKEAMLNVAPTGRCDDETIEGIKAFQETMREKIPGTKVDKRVGPARGYEDGSGVFTIVSLNRPLRRHFAVRWLRLLDFPDCPPLLKAKVAEIL